MSFKFCVIITLLRILLFIPGFVTLTFFKVTGMAELLPLFISFFLRLSTVVEWCMVATHIRLREIKHSMFCETDVYLRDTTDTIFAILHLNLSLSDCSSCFVLDSSWLHCALICCRVRDNDDLKVTGGINIWWKWTVSSFCTSVYSLLPVGLSVYRTYAWIERAASVWLDTNCTHEPVQGPQARCCTVLRHILCFCKLEINKSDSFFLTAGIPFSQI